MNFTAIDQRNVNELLKAFEHFLKERNIHFTFMRITEDSGLLSFDFCNNIDKARSVEFDGSNCIGLTYEYIANEILVPILPRLKAFSKMK
ncbi:MULTISPECIES: hypothetical protein [Bacillus]|uniref:hypothetical protein n=1 Tax=Bacillus TaxID=1386 RepID=UPI0002E82D84|nr:MULTISPECIES: hypothetical protein [Bacillus]